MGGQRKFRNSLNGFNKQDVLDYIGELNRYMASAERRANERIRELECENAELSKRAGELAELVQTPAPETGSQYALAEQENMRLKATVEELQTENAELMSRCSQLVRDSGEYIRKANLYDSSMRQISDALIKARQDADAIIEKAVGESDSIKEHIRRELQRAGHAYDAFRAEMDRLKGGTLDMVDSMRTQVMRLDKEIGDIRDELFLYDKLKGPGDCDEA